MFPVCRKNNNVISSSVGCDWRYWLNLARKFPGKVRQRFSVAALPHAGRVGQFQNPLLTELCSRGIGGLHDAVGIQKEHIAGMKWHGKLAVWHLGRDAQGQIAVRFLLGDQQPPEAGFRTVHERARVAGVAQRDPVAARQEGGDDSRGELAGAIERGELIVEIAHEALLIGVVDVAAEQIAELAGDAIDRRAVAGDIGEDGTGDAAAAAHGNVVDIAAAAGGAVGRGMDEDIEAGGAGGVLAQRVGAPDFHAFQRM